MLHEEGELCILGPSNPGAKAAVPGTKVAGDDLPLLSEWQGPLGELRALDFDFAVTRLVGEAVGDSQCSLQRVR